MPKAEYLDTVTQGLLKIDEHMNLVWKALAEAQDDGEDTDVYHTLNDLAGVLSKYGEEGGFFHQVLEEFF